MSGRTLPISIALIELNSSGFLSANITSSCREMIVICPGMRITGIDSRSIV
jgi:hypothetical protein